MAIIIRIDVLLAQRKMSVTELADRVGITLANLSILKNGKAKAIRFATLEAICQALDCQPGDILEYAEQFRRRSAVDTLPTAAIQEGAKGDLRVLYNELAVTEQIRLPEASTDSRRSNGLRKGEKGVQLQAITNREESSKRRKL